MIDPNALPSENELRAMREMVTHSGVSLESLVRFRSLVLHAAAEKQRAAAREAMSRGPVQS